MKEHYGFVFTRAMGNPIQIRTYLLGCKHGRHRKATRGSCDMGSLLSIRLSGGLVRFRASSS